MSKNTDDKDFDPSKHKNKDQIVSSDVKNTLSQDVQAAQRKPDCAKSSCNSNNFFSLENLGHSFNKLVASATGSKIDDVADALSQNMVDNLHLGKLVEERRQMNKNAEISPADQVALDNYSKFKNTITRQIPGFDHDALVDTLNARIAERASKNQSTVESKPSPAGQPTKDKAQAVSEPRTTKPSATIDVATPKTAKAISHEKSSQEPLAIRPVVKTDTQQQLPGTQTFSHDHLDKTTKNAPLVSERLNRQNGPKGARENSTQKPLGEINAQRGDSSKTNAAHPTSIEKPQTFLSFKASTPITIFSAVLTSARFLPQTPAERQATEKQATEKNHHGERVFLKQPVKDVQAESHHLSVHKSNVLSERAAKQLTQTDVVVQRSFPIQTERKSVVSASQERPTVRFADQQKLVELSRQLPSHQVVAEPATSKIIRSALEVPVTKSHGQVEHLKKAEDHVLNPGKPTLPKEIIRLPRALPIEKASIIQKTQPRVELVGNVLVKIDGQKHVNLSISNFLSRLSATSSNRKIDAPQAPGLRAISPAQRVQIIDRSIRRASKSIDALKEPLKEPQKEFVVTKGQIGQKRYILGSEIAFVAMLAVGGIAKSRQERVIPQDIGSNSTPRPNPDLAHESFSEKIEATLRDGLSTPQSSSLLDVIARRIDDQIDSFAIPVILMQEIKANKKLYPLDSQKVLKQILVNNSGAETEVAPQPLYRPVILVEPGDTLQSIAERYYNDKRIGWLIADLNLGNVRESNVDSMRIISLQSRQTLTLPVWIDIENFYQNDLADLKIDQLVTVVETSQVDIELYSNTFANVIDNKSK